MGPDPLTVRLATTVVQLALLALVGGAFRHLLLSPASRELCRTAREDLRGFARSFRVDVPVGTGRGHRRRVAPPTRQAQRHPHTAVAAVRLDVDG
ncbi:hypothetical protein DVS28_b0277 (plasmid) [Euzebya pacifica]|uniref:Uncharacterized protein n=1 Tax=Euzebya pacifica TaxID=1608957 RepID=A0A346Y6F0_9ACTN|nr:hypothetical protein [Euzebya pacifica]AXV10047.1 hypothetical protein DVS28_b0277 [Euzebya pacifica]